ncbi:MAG: tetratricopeptide repeat protein [Desulfobulbus sp.]
MNFWKLLVFSALFINILSSPVLANFKEGVAAYEAGNVSLAVIEFRASAEEGHADSQFNLALMYEQGIGVSKDEREAIAWYQKAAQQGNSNAQYNLAVLYENGRGSDVNFEQAHQWYRKAAVQGDALAVGNLGMLYLCGQGVTEDKVAGLALLLLSVTMDNSPENHAKQNVALIKGLTPEVIAAAQTLSLEMGKDGNLLVALDRYLKNTESENTDALK